MTTSPLKRSLLPSGSSLLDDGRLVVEPRSVAAGGLTGAFGARVQSVLDRQRVRGQITQRQFDAGEKLYRAWALGVEGARQDTKGCSAWTPAGYSDSRLDALKLYKGAQQYIGLSRWPLLFHVICLDWTVHRFSIDCDIRRDGTQAILRTALDDLADYLKLPKGS
jgi:hypothetical protein